MKPTITFDQFVQMDLRTGKVIEAFNPEWSPKLIQLKVDFGPEIGQRSILTGVRQWYTPEDLLGRTFVFIINLAERKMGEAVSQGMMLMADGEKPVPMTFAEEVPIGAPIT